MHNMQSATGMELKSTEPIECDIRLEKSTSESAFFNNEPLNLSIVLIGYGRNLRMIKNNMNEKVKCYLAK